MRRTLMIITVALVLCLCGCSEIPQISDMPTEPSQSESLPIKKSEGISQETDAPQSSVNIDTPEESGIASETMVADVRETVSTPPPKEEIKQDSPKEETRATGDSVTTSSFELVKPSSEPAETKALETTHVTEKPKETEEPKPAEAPKETEPPVTPVEIEPEPSFDINYWISYAQGVAVSKGLTLESSAVDCWDNPINANPDCIYLERDINSRMSRYAKDEDITDVWIWYNEGGRSCYHGYQSFKADEVDADTAHNIGVALAKELWGDRFQVVVATHCNTGHYHNHFVINSVSDVDGKKFYNSPEDYRRMREVSDRLCREARISVLDNPEKRGKNYGEWSAEKNGKPTLRGKVREDIDRAIAASTTERDFIRVMNEMGYEIVTKTDTGAPRIHPIVKIVDGDKHFRLDKLGEFYELDSIKQRIQNNVRRKVPFPEVKEDKNAPYYHYKERSEKATGLYALYLYYCYELHIIIHKPASVKKVSAYLRDDVIKLDQYIAQADFLGRTGITTTDELAAYQGEKTTRLESLSDDRKGLRNQLKQCTRKGDEKSIEETKARIAEISKEMKSCRKEIELCTVIAERSAKVQENLEQLKQQETERKEKTTDEFVVLDPKGELLRDTGNLLKEQGYDIKVLDLINMEKSHCYNPFVYLHSDDDIQRLTTNLFKNTTPKGSQTQDPFWDQTAAMLLKALVCYLHYEAPPDEQNFPMIMEMIRSGDVKEDNEEYQSVLDELFERLEAKNPEHIALKYYRAYHSGSAKTLKSIQISLVSRLEKFNLDSLAGITQVDEMELESIGEKKTAVFAVIPDNDSSFNFIVGMLYTQLFQQLYYQADSVHGGRLPVHVHFVMDEFANVALPDEFDKLLSTMRSREISVSIIIQNLAQLKALFEKQWESIVGNCDEFLYLGGNEQSTHEYVSKLLGKETIDTNTYGRSRGRNGNYSTNYQLVVSTIMNAAGFGTPQATINKFVKQFECIKVELKSANEIEWIRSMNSIRSREIVLREVIYN